MNILITALVLLAPLGGQAEGEKVRLPTADDARVAIERGIAFLLKDQNPDGSWGGPQDSITTWSGSIWPNPESHRSWKVATTGLAFASLLETGSTPEAAEAADRALGYLLANTDVKRPSEWDTMNNWAYIYGLEGLAVAYAHPRYADDEKQRQQIAEGAATFARGLEHFQSVSGGWGYLETNPPRTSRPQWATSFMTAAAVVALARAQQAGLAVDQAVIDRGVRVVNHCRLRNGAYTYHVRVIPSYHPEYIDQIKGSLSRIQVCQSALMLAGQEVSVEDRQVGLAHFFRDHKFLELALHKPVPHEAYYANSGYFYMFGHYYAAFTIESLPPEEQEHWWPKLRYEIMKIQQKDGSIWDYDVHRYDRPYGVAYGIMALGRSLPDA